MDLNNFQRKAILFIFISILAGAVLLSRKEPFKEHIPEEPKIKGQSESNLSIPTKIDINTADIALLAKLPGIGPGSAKQIIDYRAQHGPFKTFNELQKVPGIGPKRAERIREIITLENTSSEKEKAPSAKINLNTATSQQLATIIGIGPKLAQAIVDYRTQNGPFHSIDELTLVPKIGTKTCKKLKEYLYLDPEQKPTTAQKTITTRKRSHEIDISLRCPYCGRIFWEEGKKKRVYLRCPHCLKLLNEE